MPTHDASSAELLVFTYKEGILSAVAHDLKIQVTRFTATVSEDRVTVEADAGSLKVRSAMKDGAEYPGGLPSVAFPEIDRTIASSAVLDAARHPTVRFVSTAVSPTSLSGTLTVKGRSAAVSGVLSSTPTHHVAEFRFDQRDLGMKPYTAMLGTMKVAPVVMVRAMVPRS